MLIPYYFQIKDLPNIIRVIVDITSLKRRLDHGR